MTKSTLKKILAALLLSMPLAGLASPDFWIDVRSAEEFNQSHVAAAIQIPHTSIADQIHTVTTDKSAEIFLYCGSGRRADIALAELQAMGYTRITNIGGIADALKVEKATSR